METVLYKVQSIKHLDGTNRSDGRYPLRIGRTCEFLLQPETGKCLYLEWKRNADGSEYYHWFRTSIVQQVERHDDGTLIVTTYNSIYTFVRLL